MPSTSFPDDCGQIQSERPICLNSPAPSTSCCAFIKIFGSCPKAPFEQLCVHSAVLLVLPILRLSIILCFSLIVVKIFFSAPGLNAVTPKFLSSLSSSSSSPSLSSSEPSPLRRRQRPLLGTSCDYIQAATIIIITLHSTSQYSIV